MRRALLLLTLALAAGGALFWALDYSRGFILIAVGNHLVQISLWLAALVLAGLWLLWRLAALLLRPGLRSWRGRSLRRAARAQRELLSALADYYEGRWARARKALVRSARGSAIPGLNYVLAADAAAHLGEDDAARELLAAAARELPPTSPGLILARARFALQRGELDQALDALRQGHVDHPDHPRIVELLGDCLLRREHWDELEALLPALRRSGPPRDLADLEARLYAARMAALASPAAGGDVAARRRELAALWARVPPGVQARSDCLRAHARALLALGDPERAERELRRHLERDWDPDLVLDWEAATRDDELRAHLAVAERWLRERGGSWQLLLALGRLCRRLDVRGKSRDYLEQAARLEARPEIHAELGEVLSAGGDSLGAVRCYRQAANAAVRARP
ncbi:MAG: heme biosynthesis protein HemY [Pseudomonadota bacterium]